MDDLSLMQKFSDPELINTLTGTEKATGSLITALMGMGITFIVLTLLWGIVALMTRMMEGHKPARAAAPAAAIAVATTPGVDTAASAAGQAPAPAGTAGGASFLADTELAAVIAAAIAASTGQSTDSFVVRKIARLSGSTPAWAFAGRRECIDSRRM